MVEPTIIEQPSAVAAEAARAKFWRKGVMKITRTEMRDLTGYSVQAIALFEKGHDSRGKPLGERAWRKYRLVCAGLGVKNFTWGVQQ